MLYIILYTIYLYIYIYIHMGARPVVGLQRFELKIMTTNNGGGLWNARLAKGKRISYYNIIFKY